MPKEAQPTQQFIDIAEIRDDVVILRGGALRRVLMVSGINIELQSEEEQNLILATYQNFLNTLDFSLQFLIHSRKLNIAQYLEMLKEREAQESNELLRNQISEYVEFIRSFVELNAVMAKTFFAVVPYDPVVMPGSGNKKLFGILDMGKKLTAPFEQTFERQLTQLNQRTEQVVSGLSQIGLRVVVLNKEELIELFYNLYNPGTVEKRELKIAEQK